MSSTGDQPTGGSKEAPRSVLLRCLVGFPTVLCFMLSVSSICVCLLMSFKTSQLENRLYALEMENSKVFSLPESALDGTVLPGQRSSYETLHERLSQVMPKLRTARDVNQDCTCPPVTQITSPPQ
ncbi:hypothetical protein DPEC_G00024490 [Dallia pectoralis]|uniref:Uncharacterized protein n=1 Tax=Dallia pectoralis TaxID=75939 RepID=A0ACC2HH19_DALPE|nr:hypothetical protein DPEC_G00024490 [Dallia pectoralis]